VETVDSGYDALLVVSFGGPEGMDDVIPFLENVLRGRNVPPERMKAVSHHYELFGGVSPINEQNRRLIAALEKELADHGPHLPIYWGNRNWHPMLTDTVAQMAKDGVKRALAFVTSAYGSQSSCRQYLENIADAREKVSSSDTKDESSTSSNQLNAPEIDKLRLYFNHPGFIEANVERLKEALEQLPEDRRGWCKVAYTAHSIPLSMADNCQYAQQLKEAARLISEGCGISDWDVVYQSRSGPPSQPWLEPDIVVYLNGVAGDGYKDLVVLPVGFISDHMEVIYDLDTEAKKAAEEAGLNLVRAGTVGCHARFISMIRELIDEKVKGIEPRFVGEMGLLPEQCAPSCCVPVARPATPQSHTSSG
jgi:protoporphyrin/coproporphyrin ferrochelatase